MGAANGEQGPRFIGRCENLFAVVEWDNLVVATMNDEDRTIDVLDVLPCRVTQTTQPAHRQPRVEFLGDVRDRGK